jgi:hypothetical protein
MDMKKRLFQLGIYLPQIRVEGQYNLQGKVLILPLLGNGPAKINLSEYSGQWNVHKVPTKYTCQATVDMFIPQVLLHDAVQTESSH